MTKRIVLALALLAGISGGALAAACLTAPSAAACDPHTS